MSAADAEEDELRKPALGFYEGFGQGRDSSPGSHRDAPAFHSHLPKNVPHFHESDCGVRMRGAMNGRVLLPNPNFSATDPILPPGFGNTRISPDCGPSQSHHPGSSVPETSEGGSSALQGKEKTKKRKTKLGAEDAQPYNNNYERATKACHKLWKDLDCAIQRRERELREKEARVTPSSVNREVFEEDKKQTAAMKSEIMEERKRLEEEAQRVRVEKDAMERTSTELAVQVVELKQEWRRLEKEKADLLARRAELSTN